MALWWHSFSIIQMKILRNFFEARSWHNFLDSWNAKQWIVWPVKSCFRQAFDPEDNIQSNESVHLFERCWTPACIRLCSNRLHSKSICFFNYLTPLWTILKGFIHKFSAANCEKYLYGGLPGVWDKNRPKSVCDWLKNNRTCYCHFLQ